MTLWDKIFVRLLEWEESKTRKGPTPRRGPGPNQGTRIHHRSFVCIVLYFQIISTVIKKKNRKHSQMRVGKSELHSFSFIRTRKIRLSLRMFLF